MLIDMRLGRPYNRFIMQKSLIAIAIGLVVLSSSFVHAQQPDANPVVSSEKKMVTAIEVTGNKTISLATILAKIKTRVNEEYIQNVVSDDLKRLYNTGFFSDVRVDRQDHNNGFKVVFNVEEKPVVEEITFSKLRYYKPAYLLKKMQTKKGKFLDRKALKDDEKVIKDLYEKKGLTLATVRLEEEADKLNDKVKLHFVIDEGVRVKVRQIKFFGNEQFSRKRLMRVIKSRPDGIFTSGYLKEQVLEEDIARIKGFYEKEGFIDVKVRQEFEDYKKGKIFVKIFIEEGKQYFVDSVTIKGNDIISKEDILKAMKYIKEGNVFSRDKLSLDLAEIRTVYFDQGYIFAQLRESTALNPETGRVGVQVEVVEGELAFINKIKIQGNTRTRDIVVRRELKLFPGDRFDGSKLRRSKERLTDLGYFSDITYDIEDTDVPERKNLIVQVEEAKTGSFNFGGGYSTVDNLVGFFEVEQKNFDFTNWPTFTGGGQDISFRAESGSSRNNFQLSFTEPWIMDYPISGGFDLYLAERDRESDTGYSYDERRKGINLRLGKQIAEYVYGNTNYRLENADISNVDPAASNDLKAEAGENTVSSMGFTLTRDIRDSTLNPTKGYMVSSTLDVAGGPFGFDKDFYRLSGRGSYHVPLKYDSVLEFRLRAGMVTEYGSSDSVPIFERFFAGGARSIRGYDERKVGPLDSLTDDPIGGESLLVGNVEWTIPLVEFLKFAVFYDVGNVWAQIDDFGNGGYKSGTGVGFRLKTPIGPVNLDYGYPLDDEPGEESRSGKFYFSVSRGF